MELKDIKELMAAMERAGMKELKIKKKTGDELHLIRQDEHAPVVHHSVAPSYPPVFHPAPTAASVPHKPHPVEEIKEGRYVTSPMVGTFYASPSPDDPHFVKVGDRVDENTVVCIIEAMKVMNEVKAGVAGVIAEILVDNAHPVEFGTKIMRIV
ncbi:MAG: acetyl-CoA carboxylase biotin carboxyl carrier protein [Rhabdochlamydiaceae bacterium]|nr:acetyl-CoA carboxylase biotin carboxyl carrier protein [Rhabdochlamydiaceae bacterium]